MRVLMLGNGFDLYHNLLSHYDDFMTICEYLIKKHSVICYDRFDGITIYSELCNLTQINENIKKKLLAYEEVYKKAKINKYDYTDFLTKLESNYWFKYFLDCKNRYGWVALENQTDEVLSKFRKRNSRGLDIFVDAIKEEYDYRDAVDIYIKEYIFNGEKFDEFIFSEYREFIEVLKLYLKIFVDNILPDIANIYELCNDHFRDNDYILTFNYTDTYAKLYSSTANIIHIHGKLNNEIVLGVNSNEYDNIANADCRFIQYKKYYQRITKHTLDDLKKMIRRVESTPATEERGLIIMGHSLDISDEDIITVLFDFFDYIVVYYHNDAALGQYVKNLKLIFGAKELSKMTFSQKVIFQKLPPNEYMRCCNDQL